MSRKRTSPIWLCPKKELEKLTKESESFTAILRAIGVCPESGGSSLRSLKDRLSLEGIDYSHITSSNKGKHVFRESIPLESVLVENSSYCRRTLKKRLIKDGLLRPVCDCCGLGTVWNGKPLVLVLDHKNGIRNDNRIENLRLVCPNCNSQADTFSGRNNKKSIKFLCCKCNKPRSRNARLKMCYECSQIFRFRERKVPNRPTKDVLKKEVQELGYLGTSRKYGVTDNCIRKWLRVADIV